MLFNANGRESNANSREFSDDDISDYSRWISENSRLRYFFSAVILPAYRTF